MAMTNPPGAPLTRRSMLQRCGMGMASLGLLNMLRQTNQLAFGGEKIVNPLAPKQPHFAPKAKRVIHIFANGGPSQVDTFDPKPMLDKYAGKTLPSGNLTTERPTGAAFPSPFKFKPYGKSGIEVSELFPHVGECIDDICVIRSMYTNLPNHDTALMLLNCGDTRQIRPSMGAWVTYGLGSENQNLPGFIAMCPAQLPHVETRNWQSVFLPGAYQGTYIDTQHTQVEKLVENIRNSFTSLKDQRQQLDVLLELNRQHEAKRAEEAQLEARLQSFELAYRMQTEASDAFDLSKEPKSILDMYGSGTNARQFLIARRLIERGVRFVQAWHGGGAPWDSHDKLKDSHTKLARETDQGIAALLKDLKQRGLLEDTLVIWGGEFGRTPAVEMPAAGGANAGTMDGRDHNPYGFSMWMAGGGVKGGYVHGTTDEFGYKAVDKRMHVHDLQATILHLLGFDHEKLTYRHAGRDFRLTDVHGHVVKEICK